MCQDRRDDLANVAYLSAGRDDDRTRSDHLVVAILLGHGQRVFSGRDVDAQLASEIGRGLYGLVEARVLALVAARPHPVGAQ